MFDVWRGIDEEGAVAVPVKESALSALGWVEVGEKYPELVPEKFRRYDVYADPQLIRESPFVAVSHENSIAYHFKTSDPVSGSQIDAWIDPLDLVVALGCDYFHTDDVANTFGGVVVCSCGIAGCAGLWSQTCHVSEKMVHWAIVHDDDKLELFFEREAYEKGALKMLKSLVEDPEKYTLPGPDGSFSEDEHTAFAEEIEKLLDRRSYFRDMWQEIAAEDEA